MVDCAGLRVKARTCLGDCYGVQAAHTGRLGHMLDTWRHGGRAHVLDQINDTDRGMSSTLMDATSLPRATANCSLALILQNIEKKGEAFHCCNIWW